MSGVCPGGSLGAAAGCLLYWTGCADSKQNPPPSPTPRLSRRLNGLIRGSALASVAVQAIRRSEEACSLGLRLGLLSPPAEARATPTAPGAARRPRTASERWRRTDYKSKMHRKPWAVTSDCCRLQSEVKQRRADHRYLTGTSMTKHMKGNVSNSLD